jgi:iron complex outermembrane receptor protein
MKLAHRRHLMASTLMVSALVAFPAQAQDSTRPTQETPAQTTNDQAASPAATGVTPAGDDVPEAPAQGDIVVTGSRIASPAAASASPLQVIGSEQIQQQGAINVQEVLLQNPAFGAPGISRTNSSFATQGAGAATVNLRNLGEDRTLVLVNGRRFVSGQPGSQAVDLNVIPTQFIDRIDVLTGGASAVYGSDAVAGVVNIIYKNRFQGLQADGQLGISEEGDGFDRQISLLGGKNFAGDRGNIMLFGSYSKEGTVFKKDRSTEAGSSAVDSTSNDVLPNDPLRPFLSTYAPGGRVYAGDQTFSYNSGSLVNCTDASCGGFNRSDYRYLAVPVERYVAAGRGTFELSPAANLWVEGNYAKTKVDTVIEPFPLDSTFGVVGASGQIPIQSVVGGVTYRNPYVPDAIFNAATDTDGDGLRDVAFDRRLADFGNRTSSAERDLFRVAAGVNGKFLGDRWSYELYGIYGQSKEHQEGTGQFDTRRFQQALNAYTDPATGQAVCADPAARAAGCVPANIYGIGTLTQAAGYLAVPTTLDAKVSQTVFGGNVTGKLFSLFGADPIGINIGTEYRRETSSNTFDLLTQQGLNGNNALPATSGRFHVWEGFGEAIVPIIQDKPFFHSLSLRGAVRVSDYSTVGRTFSYNYGGEWAPVSDIRFRVIKARSVRAPNINELFQPAQQDFPSGLIDPCAGTTLASTGTLGTQCLAAAGVRANIAANNGTFAVSQTDKQGITSFGGGNLGLQEEKGDSFTAGVVINPRSINALRNLVVTVDYFNVQVKDAIVFTPLQFTLAQCYNQGNQDYCSQIVRRATAQGGNSAGSIDQVNGTYRNSGGIKTSGIDTTVTFRQNMADLGLAGTLGLRGSYTHLISGYVVPVPGSDRDYFAGEANDLGGSPRDKFTINGSFDIQGVGLTMTGTWLSQASVDDQLTGARPGSVRAYRVSPQFYLDSQLRFRTGNGYEFFFGGDNLLNNKPPYLADIGSSAGQDTAASLYDPLGRRYYAGVRISY